MSEHKDLPQSAATKLVELLQAKRVITYHENLPDPEFPQVACSVYGAPESNELYVKLTNGIISFVEATPSALFFPPMAERIFGMDVLDSNVSFALADRMWTEHKAALIAKA